MITHITCGICQKKFVAYHNSKYCITCKAKSRCMNTQKHYRKKNGTSRRLRICLACKEQYVIIANSQKYCKKCVRSVHILNCRTYYKNNRERITIQNKEHIKTIKDNYDYRLKRKLYTRIYRCRKKSLIQSFTLEEWKTKIKRTSGVCFGCNRIVGVDKLELDHIIPVSKAPPGFVYTINDVQPLCRSCNAIKCNKI